VTVSFRGLALYLTSDCCLLTGPVAVPCARAPAVRNERIAAFALETSMLTSSRNRGIMKLDGGVDWKGTLDG